MTYIIVIIATVLLIGAACISLPRSAPKGSFVVRGYKNGELVYVETVVDGYYVATAGDKFDRVEITEK